MGIVIAWGTALLMAFLLHSTPDMDSTRYWAGMFITFLWPTLLTPIGLFLVFHNRNDWIRISGSGIEYWDNGTQASIPFSQVVGIKKETKEDKGGGLRVLLVQERTFVIPTDTMSMSGEQVEELRKMIEAQATTATSAELT